VRGLLKACSSASMGSEATLLLIELPWPSVVVVVVVVVVAQGHSLV